MGKLKRIVVGLILMLLMTFVVGIAAEAQNHNSSYNDINHTIIICDSGRWGFVDDLSNLVNVTDIMVRDDGSWAILYNLRDSLVNINHIVLWDNGTWTIVDSMTEHPSSFNWVGWVHISRDGSPPPWENNDSSEFIYTTSQHNGVLNRPLWDSAEHRNPNPVHSPTNGEVQRFLENFHMRQLGNNQNPPLHDWQTPQWTPEDERLSQEFVRGFIDAASRDTFFKGMPFNIAYMEEILTPYRVYFAPGRGGWAAAEIRKIFISFNRNQTDFANLAVHEIAHALGLGEQLAHVWESELIFIPWYDVNDSFYPWPSRPAWYRCTHMDRILLSKVDPVDFWRAAFTSNQAYAELWNRYMLHIATFDDMQMARTVATHASGVWVYDSLADVIITDQIRRDVNIAVPTLKHASGFHSPDGYWHDIMWGWQLDDYELLGTLRLLPIYVRIAHSPGYWLAQSDIIIIEANHAIVQLANYGRQHGLHSIEAVFDWTFTAYLQFNDMNFLSQSHS